MALTACPGQKGGDNPSTVTAQGTTPLNPRCLDGSTYCPQYNYNSYQQYGWMAYPNYYYGTASNGSFCNCPAGYSPSYNPSWGLGCLSNAYGSSLTNYLVYWNTNSYFGYTYSYAHATPVYSNNSVNIGQVSNMQGGNYTAQCTSTNNLSQACFINQANSCPSNSRCAPTASGSPIGVCISSL